MDSSSHAPISKQDNLPDGAHPEKDDDDDDVDAAAPYPSLDLESLPLETRCPPFRLRQHPTGFWLPEITLAAGIPALHSRLFFTPRPATDVLLASFPKSGTTWLKALAFAARNRSTLPPPSHPLHPLRHSLGPHDCVRFLELELALASTTAVAEEFEALPSPRTLATHLPYSLLPERVRSGARIVYVCRDPKDALVSSWLFTRKVAAPAFGADAEEVEAFTLRHAFELFCDGRCVCGPQWRHALEYWEAAAAGGGGGGGEVLFLRYEEMLRKPRSSVRKLAEFMGCAFSEEEEAAGVVDGIVELCSLETLKSAAVNRSGNRGKVLPVGNETFFRKGGAGGWREHMTPEMGEALDRIVEQALQGSGLRITITHGSSA